MTVIWSWWMNRGEEWERGHFRKGVQQGISKGVWYILRNGINLGQLQRRNGWRWSSSSGAGNSGQLSLFVSSSFPVRNCPSPHSFQVILIGLSSSPFRTRHAPWTQPLAQEWSHDPIRAKHLVWFGLQGEWSLWSLLIPSFLLPPKIMGWKDPVRHPSLSHVMESFCSWIKTSTVKSRKEGKKDDWHYFSSWV